MKTILCLFFIVLASASVKADQVVVATSGSGTVFVSQTGSSAAVIVFEFANGGMGIHSDAIVSTHCNQVGCLPGTTVSVSVVAGKISSSDLVSFIVDGTTFTCTVNKFCAVGLGATATIPFDGGGPASFFSVTVPFTMDGSVHGFGEELNLSILGSGFASFDLTRSDSGYIVPPGSMHFTFTPEPGSIVLLLSGLLGLGFILRKGIRNVSTQNSAE